MNGDPIPLPTAAASIGFCPQNPSDKTGAAMAVAPVSYSFAPVIASSKQLLYGVRLNDVFFSLIINYYAQGFSVGYGMFFG